MLHSSEALLSRRNQPDLASLRHPPWLAAPLISFLNVLQESAVVFLISLGFPGFIGTLPELTFSQ
jgi:hypothetical protein